MTVSPPAAESSSDAAWCTVTGRDSHQPPRPTITAASAHCTLVIHAGSIHSARWMIAATTMSPPRTDQMGRACRTKRAKRSRKRVRERLESN